MESRIKTFSEYESHYGSSMQESDAYWGKIAEEFVWKKKWDKVQSGNFNDLNVKWFEGGKLNITENCLDRHLEKRGDNIAINYEGNQPDSLKHTMTYRELHAEVCKFSNVLTDMGVKKGDRVCFYMAMVPELLIGVLATARIGAVHSVVFGGFSSQALAGRIQDSTCKILVTNDGTFRGGKHIGLKGIADEALKSCPSIEKSIVVKRSFQPVEMKEGRDIWWHDEIRDASAKFDAVEMDSEDPLFILYTSGSTGQPKGLVHTCGGYMVYAAQTFKNVFQVEQDDTYWCTADIGWITGHTYITYGPLLNGVSTLMFEGVPTYPDAGRFWELIDKYEVTHLYTAPTAIRALMASGLDFVNKRDLSTLKVLGSVGEPINEEAWDWYHKNIGKEKCPLVDTWWQTETGGIMITPLAGITKLKPTFASLPFPGVEPVLMDENGKEYEGNGVSGNLCLKRPWPGIARTIYGDHDRYKQTYFSTYPGYYFTGDGCLRDEDGYYRITGRVDDVMNVSGHRIGTAEVEDAINMHDNVVESAIVGYPHDIKGQGIYAYIICNETPKDEAAFKKEVLGKVIEVIGPIAKPDKMQVVSGLPKTRSGKIMRRILRKIAEGDTSNLGDTSTLLNPAIVDELKEGAI
jgi:acetyl-CoA synthetase